jgi:hypothetical protein
MGTIVARAITVSRQVRALSTELDELKAQIRDAAIAERTDGDRVEFPSSEGTAPIVFPTAKVAICDGADPAVLKAILPQATWERIFAVKIAPAERLARSGTRRAARRAGHWTACSSAARRRPA